MLKSLTSRYRHLYTRESSIQGQTRIKILFICILAFFSLCTLLCMFYILGNNDFLLYRAITWLFFLGVCMALLLIKIPYKIPAHLFMVSLTLIVWSNIVFLRQGFNLVTVQYTFVVLSVSYYILGLRWGLIYSVINIFPVIGSIIMINLLKSGLSTQQISINHYTYAIAVVLNFLLLLYIHYAFFRALTKSNIKEQKLKKNLKKSVKASKEMAASKTNFLNTMSHELRTPLNAVVGIANLLLMENPKSDQLKDLNILLFSAENLMGTINNILEFNQIDKKKHYTGAPIFPACRAYG